MNLACLIEYVHCFTQQNRANKVRSVNAVLSATTNFYNGVKANEVRRATATFILQPNARKTPQQSALALRILPSDRLIQPS